MKRYSTVPEIMVSGLGTLGKIDATVDEITLDLSRNKAIQQTKISRSSDAAEFLRQVFSHDPHNLPPYEMFWIVLLNTGNKIIGVYNLSSGGITGTIADPTMAFAVAIKALASSMIMAHNHPSGTNKPSEGDKRVTEKFKKIGEIHSIPVLDHIIITNDSHYSFADEGEISLSGITEEITVQTNKNPHTMITKQNIASHQAQIESMTLPVAVSGSYDAIKLMSDDFTDWADFDQDPALEKVLDKFLEFINTHSQPKEEPHHEPEPTPVIEHKKEPEPVKHEKVKKEKAPRKAREPKPKKEKPAKVEKTKISGENIPAEVRIIKRYLALDGKTVYMDAVRNLLTALQKAIRTHEIRKTSTWASEIMHVQKNLLDIWNRHGESTTAKVEITLDKADHAMMASMKKDASEYAIMTPIVLIKRFLAIQGKSKIKAKAGLKSVATALAKQAKAYENDHKETEYKYKHELLKVITSLDKYLSGETKTVHLSYQNLNGLAGLGLIDFNHKIKVGDKVRTYDSARGKVVKVHDDSIEIDTRPGHFYSKKKVKSLNKDCGCSGAGCLEGIETETIIPEINTPAPAPASAITLPMTDPNTMNSQDFAAMQFTTVGFTGKWLSLIGDPTEPWSMMVWSKPGKGKSTLMIELAKYLASEHDKKVLYVAREEGFGATLLEKFRRLDAIDPLITIAAQPPVDYKSGYDYVFIDSVTSLKLATDDLSAMMKANPHINFIFIFQATVDGNYRGDKEAEHLVDVSIVINENGFATARKTRFGGKGTINVFPTAGQVGSIFKFSTLQDANAYKNKPENAGMRIVFGDDRKIWVCSEAQAITYRQKGFDIL